MAQEAKIFTDEIILPPCPQLSPDQCNNFSSLPLVLTLPRATLPSPGRSSPHLSEVTDPHEGHPYWVSTICRQACWLLREPWIWSQKNTVDSGSTLDRLLWARSFGLSGPPTNQGGGEEVGDVESLWCLRALHVHDYPCLILLKRIVSL